MKTNIIRHTIGAALLLLSLSAMAQQRDPGEGSWPDYNPGWQPAFDHLYNNMVRVEGGSYVKNGQTVSVGTFYVCRYEVTQALWEKMMENRSEHLDPMMPVENVKWYECQEFITNLEYYFGKKFRLLTEAEWEWAARGGNLSQGHVCWQQHNRRCGLVHRQQQRADSPCWTETAQRAGALRHERQCGGVVPGLAIDKRRWCPWYAPHANSRR